MAARYELVVPDFHLSLPGVWHQDVDECHGVQVVPIAAEYARCWQPRGLRLRVAASGRRGGCTGGCGGRTGGRGGCASAGLPPGVGQCQLRGPAARVNSRRGPEPGRSCLDVCRGPPAICLRGGRLQIVYLQEDGVVRNAVLLQQRYVLSVCEQQGVCVLRAQPQVPEVVKPIDILFDTLGGLGFTVPAVTTLQVVSVVDGQRVLRGALHHKEQDIATYVFAVDAIEAHVPTQQGVREVLKPLDHVRQHPDQRLRLEALSRLQQILAIIREEEKLTALRAGTELHELHVRPADGVEELVVGDAAQSTHPGKELRAEIVQEVWNVELATRQRFRRRAVGRALWRYPVRVARVLQALYVGQSRECPVEELREGGPAQCDDRRVLADPLADCGHMDAEHCGNGEDVSGVLLVDEVAHWRLGRLVQGLRPPAAPKVLHVLLT
mmetsp:Transcript_14232/g.28683  ORF Transcript_14232/g.28683 Transcript_14232/m.28683 type:complete len:438 (+) Transcript_14232:155-1468(+)